MFRRELISCCCLPAMLAIALLTSSLLAQGVAGPGPAGVGANVAAGPSAMIGQPPMRLATRSDVVPPAPNAASAPELKPGDPHEHPLMPALRWARDGLSNIEKIQDYSATLVKRERIGNKVGEYQYMYVKVRQHPFSVYMYFLKPASERGQEVIYINGANDNKMWAHAVGIRDTMFGTVSLQPDGVVAMRNQRYPLTELGLLNLVRRLILVGEQDVKYGECDVKFFKGAKINGRVCTCVQITHPVPRRNFLFHLAKIFVDDELNVPIRYEAYEWPREPGGTPELIEEYTYLNLKLNNGFTDADFDRHNSNYHFR